MSKTAWCDAGATVLTLTWCLVALLHLCVPSSKTFHLRLFKFQNTWIKLELFPLFWILGRRQTAKDHDLNAYPHRQFPFCLFYLRYCGPFECTFAFPHFISQITALWAQCELRWECWTCFLFLWSLSENISSEGLSVEEGGRVAFGPQQETLMTHLFLWQQAILTPEFTAQLLAATVIWLHYNHSLAYSIVTTVCIHRSVYLSVLLCIIAFLSGEFTRSRETLAARQVYKRKQRWKYEVEWWESFVSLIFLLQADSKRFNRISGGTMSILLMACILQQWQ